MNSPASSAMTQFTGLERNSLTHHDCSGLSGKEFVTGMVSYLHLSSSVRVAEENTPCHRATETVLLLFLTSCVPDVTLQISVSLLLAL